MVRKIKDAAELQEALQEAGDKLVILYLLPKLCVFCKFIEKSRL